MREIILAGKHQTRCILIDPVDYPRSYDTVNVRQFIFAVSKQSIYKRALSVSGSRMNDHTLRFVDNKKIGILVNYIKRNVLSNERLIVNGRRDISFNNITCGKFSTRFCRLQ